MGRVGGAVQCRRCSVGGASAATGRVLAELRLLHRARQVDGPRAPKHTGPGPQSIRAPGPGAPKHPGPPPRPDIKRPPPRPPKKQENGPKKL